MKRTISGYGQFLQKGGCVSYVEVLLQHCYSTNAQPSGCRAFSVAAR